MIIKTILVRYLSTLLLHIKEVAKYLKIVYIDKILLTRHHFFITAKTNQQEIITKEYFCSQ